MSLEYEQPTGLYQFPEPRYTMGFAVNGHPIPDPSVYTGKESDLDVMGKRDANGYLHRSRVATKYPLKLEYNNIPWDRLMDICALMSAEKFNFTYPSPFTGGMETMEAYVGDRDFEDKMSLPNGVWIASLKFSVIQY